MFLYCSAFFFMNLKCFLILSVGSSSSVFSVTIDKCPNWMCMNLILAQFFKLKKKNKMFLPHYGNIHSKLFNFKKNNQKFSCIVNFRLFHMHYIKTAISILMYRFCKYYTMYVRLNCICSVYVIYLCPINVLILSVLILYFNWTQPFGSTWPLLAGQCCCAAWSRGGSPQFTSGCFCFVMEVVFVKSKFIVIIWKSGVLITYFK